MTELDAAVIGAGFAGLGAGAALRQAGVQRFALIEQGGDVGHFWSKTYDRIHLHSPWHDLPNDGGLIRRYPKFKSRDELIRYFGEYADRFDLRRSIRFNERVAQVKREGERWRLDTSAGTISVRYLAVAPRSTGCRPCRGSRAASSTPAPASTRASTATAGRSRAGARS